MKNKNSEAIIILCSQLCIGENIKPFTTSEWSKFAVNIMKKKLTPSDIINMNLGELKKIFPLEEAERINNLIGRSGSIVFEIGKLKERGIDIVTRADKEYPKILKNKLGKNCPPLFYYIGDLNLCNKKAVGIVGSRKIEEKEEKFTEKLVEKLINKDYIIVSGGAKGVDSISVEKTLELGGSAIEYISDSMISKIKKREIIEAIRNGKLLILSLARPDIKFTVQMAMARNKYIYLQSIGTVVIKSDFNKGGTWSGATTALKSGYCPVFCRKDVDIKGNEELIKKGAIPIDENWDCSIKDIKVEIKNKKEEKLKESKVQLGLFN